MSQQPGTSLNPATGHTLDPTDSTFIGFAQPVPAINPITGLPIPGQFVPHLYVLTVGSQGGPTGAGVGFLSTDTLADGIHNITARVQMIEPSNSTNPIKTAFGPRSAASQITIDTVAPPIRVRPRPQSDESHHAGNRHRRRDRARYVQRQRHKQHAPDLPRSGRSEFDRPRVCKNHQSGESKLRLAVPRRLCVPRRNSRHSDGRHERIPERPMDASFGHRFEQSRFLRSQDGLRTSSPRPKIWPATFRPRRRRSQIFIDTQGPQITDVRIVDPTTQIENTDYNLFSEKFQNSNASQGPTPLTYSIRIDIQDLPPRFAPFLDEWAFKPEIVTGSPVFPDGDGFSSGPGPDGGITVIGDANGRVAFTVFAHVVSPTNPGDPQRDMCN